MTKKEAKLSLYSSLVKIPYKDLTTQEIDMLVILAKDDEVQTHHSERRKYNEHHQ